MLNTTEIILIVGWAFVLIWVPVVIYSNRKTHPKAIFILFGAEMWERFSYYGMRALLTLYMVKELFSYMESAAADTRALGIYGSYTSMVYLTPVIGGIIADRYFGFRKAIITGGILMMLGHFALAIEGMAFGGNLPLFFLALALIIIGNGYFKPNISSFLGKFYEANDARKDGAFTIFYMGVNIGAFLSTLTCGYVGETISWHYGFGLAGIGMGFGLLVFWLLGPKYFDGKGKVPENTKPMVSWMGNNTLIWLGTLIVIPIAALLLNLDQAMSTVLLITSLVLIIYLVIMGIRDKEKSGTRLIVIVILFFFHAIFWALFEQAGGSLTLFTDRFVNREMFGSVIPPSIFQSLNPFYIMILAPVFSWMWIKLSQNKKEPPTPVKFVLGLLQMALGYAMILIGIYFFRDAQGLVPVIFIFLLYLFHTTGELSLSPVGLSMITKLSPDKIVGFTMGFWMLSIAVANKMAGEIGKLTASEGGESASLTIDSYSNTYLIWGIAVVVGFAVVLIILVPRLRKWMHGIH